MDNLIGYTSYFDPALDPDMPGFYAESKIQCSRCGEYVPEGSAYCYSGNAICESCAEELKNKIDEVYKDDDEAICGDCEKELKDEGILDEWRNYHAGTLRRPELG